MASFILTRRTADGFEETPYHIEKIAFPDEDTVIREALDAARRIIDNS